MKPLDNLHIYAQETNHDRAYIIGTREALVGLLEALQRALEQGIYADSYCTADGEGYKVVIIQTENSKIEELKLPYTKPELFGLEQPNHLHPEGFIKKYNK